MISVKFKYHPHDVKSAVWGLEDWVALSKGIELNEMIFSHEEGKPRRYIIVKKQVDIRPNAAGKELFEDLPGYRYSCYVTKMDLPLDEIWNIYNTKADCENRIKELKADFGLENFCLQDFWATEASFRFIMVAYKLMSLFTHFALNHHNRPALKNSETLLLCLRSMDREPCQQKGLENRFTGKKTGLDEWYFRTNQKHKPSFSIF